MANFTLSTSQLTGGGGSVTVTPMSATTFTGRKATGTVTVRNGTATKTVSLTKDYPLVYDITKVTVGGTNIPDWRNFTIPPSETTIVATYKSNGPDIVIYTDGFIPVTCSVKIGSKWYSASGAELTTETFFSIGENVQALTLPNNLGLTSAYEATITVKVPANPKSYVRSGDVNLGTDSYSYTQSAATATIEATPASMNWTTSETGGKAITVTSNGANIPVTVA